VLVRKVDKLPDARTVNLISILSSVFCASDGGRIQQLGLSTQHDELARSVLSAESAFGERSSKRDIMC